MLVVLLQYISLTYFYSFYKEKMQKQKAFKVRKSAQKTEHQPPMCKRRNKPTINETVFA